MMERYAHSLMAGHVLSSVPVHVRTDLERALASLDGYEGGSLRRAERLAAARMAELAGVLREFPDLKLMASGPGPSRPVPAFGAQTVQRREKRLSADGERFSAHSGSGGSLLRGG